MDLTPDIQRWLTGAMGSGAVMQSAHVLAGSTSSTLYGVELEQRGRSVSLVLRLFTNAEWLADEPDLAAHEAAVLNKAAAIPLPTPELVTVDETGAFCGVPAVLMTRVPGTIQLQPDNFDDWLLRLAETLVPLHDVDADDLSWQYFPWTDVHTLQVPGWSSVPDLWAQAIDIARGPEPDYTPCFVHRDYHPMNVLWQEKTLSGVVDWVNACRGPLGIDLAHCRLNLVAMYGPATADEFLKNYETLTGVSHHPYWDLIDLIEVLPGPPGIYSPWLEFGLSHLTPALMVSRLDDYVARVLKRLT